MNKCDSGLFQEYEKHREDYADKSGNMIPLDRLSLEEEHNNHGEDGKGDNLLDYFELHEIERATVLDIADAVGGYQDTILEECYAPR